MDYVDLREVNGLVLAYLGDAVWETQIRLFWLQKGLNLSHLNKQVKKFVNAKQQSRYYHWMLEDLREEELAVMRRAKNANIRSYPKSCSNQEYREATAFEAIIGFWYLQGNHQKIEDWKDKLIKKSLEK